jgi:NAD(P)-dependent dehydrogenase (short-subunit alcohol dehydrogenase family)
MKTAIVTGATSGIGRAAALALSRTGWWVLATGRDEVRGKDVEQELVEGFFVAADLREPGSAERIVSVAVQRSGHLDALVNNAGIHFLATVEDMSPQSYDELMTVNLRAAVMICAAAIPEMRKRGGGVIVNVASEAGVVAVPGQVAYNLSKAALIMLTKSIAVDHAQDGIRAVSICPGTTRTPLVDDAIAAAPDPAEHERWLASSRPANRLGDPDEIAAAIVFVTSQEASFMTGSEIVIDGGFTAL